MKKIPTLYVRDWEGTLGPPARFVTREPHPDCAWVFAGEGVPTRKLDGTCCLIREGVLYKRHEVRPGKDVPPGFEELEVDAETEKVIGWVPVGDGPEDKWHREAFVALLAGFGNFPPGGTYELVGPKVQGNPEGMSEHTLVPHANITVLLSVPTDYDALRDYLDGADIEGIVWHHHDGRMAKIKAKDFGLARR